MTVVIPTWNRADLLRAVLSDVARQSRRPTEVIVVDNGSTDGSTVVAEQAGATVIALPRNRGFAFAVNRGIERSRTDWIIVLNNDVSIGPDWIRTLHSSALAANAWFAIGKLRKQNEANVLDGTYDAVCRGGTSWRCGDGRPEGAIWDQPRAIWFPSFTATLLRRELFERVGLLDERFGSYLEDVDFGLRCAKSRLAGIYVPAAAGFHQGSATLGPWHKATVRLIARNQTLLIRKHFGGAPRWPVVAAHLLWGAMAFRHAAGWPWVRGKLEGFTTPLTERSQSWSSVRDIVAESEKDIERLQRETGFDTYWKLYFALVGRTG